MRVSFFTTCGDRLRHLKQTLPENIESNLDHNNVEHVVLDYGSTVGFTKYITSTFPEHLESGRLKCFTFPAKFFWHNHAKNMAAKLTDKKADVICSIDADNFTGESKDGECLASYISRVFGGYDNNNVKMFIRACGWDYVENNWDNKAFNVSKSKYASASGKIAFKRKDFFELRGFNEDLKGHYYDEEEIWRRAMMCWNWEKHDLPVEYSKFINHSNLLRLSNLDPNIVDLDSLMEDKALEFTVNDYMDDDMALPIYPQAAKNKKIFDKVLRNKVKVPNGKKWGAGTAKRIKL